MTRPGDARWEKGEDSFGLSETIPEHRGLHPHRKSGKKGQYLRPFRQKCDLKSQKMAKFQKLRKFQNSPRERHFGHFLHFRKDLSDHSQSLQKYRGRYLYQRSRTETMTIFMAI